MTKIYSTTDYFRDSFWLFDILYDSARLCKNFLGNKLKKIVNIDFETYFFRILENLPYGIAILFLGLILTIALFRATESKNGVIISPIYTNSMYPRINPGSLVVTIPQKYYGISDIITYKEKSPKNNEYTGRVLTHRIIDTKIFERNSVLYIAKGDNNKNPDSNFIRNVDVLGRVVLILPYFGYIDFLTKTIPGFAVLIGFPSLLLVFEAKKHMQQI